MATSAPQLSQKKRGFLLPIAAFVYPQRPCGKYLIWRKNSPRGRKSRRRKSQKGYEGKNFFDCEPEVRFDFAVKTLPNLAVSRNMEAE
jgi:hypothetical protein